MMIKSSQYTVATMFVATMAWAGVAQAEEPCGAGVDPASFKDCEVVQGQCNEACTDSRMVGACVATQVDSCSDQCTKALPVCEASCTAECEAACTVGIVEVCECESTCEAGCEAVCVDAPDGQGCMATCEANCESSCTVMDTDGCECEATCDATCEASCELFALNSCESCLGDYGDECTIDMAAACDASCEEGVILCDDTFVNANDVDECISELEQGGATFKQPSAAGDDLQGEFGPVAAANSCSVQDQPKLGFAGAFFTFAGFGLAGAFLRRRRSQAGC